MALHRRYQTYNSQGKSPSPSVTAYKPTRSLHHTSTMCILLTTTHSCRHKIRSAIPCGSKSFACDCTFEYTTNYYRCADCRFNFTLALEAKADSVGDHRRLSVTRGPHGNTTATSVSDSRTDDFAAPIQLSSQSPSIGWDNLRAPENVARKSKS